MAAKFYLEESGDGKELYLMGPYELSVSIDHDDVDHETVEKEASELCRLLNKYWNKPTTKH